MRSKYYFDYGRNHFYVSILAYKKTQIFVKIVSIQKEISFIHFSFTFFQCCSYFLQNLLDVLIMDKMALNCIDKELASSCKGKTNLSFPLFPSLSIPFSLSISFLSISFLPALSLFSLSISFLPSLSLFFLSISFLLSLSFPRIFISFLPSLSLSCLLYPFLSLSIPFSPYFFSLYTSLSIFPFIFLYILLSLSFFFSTLYIYFSFFIYLVLLSLSLYPSFALYFSISSSLSISFFSLLLFLSPFI